MWAKDQKCWDEGAEGAAQLWVSGSDYTVTDVNVEVADSSDSTQRVVASFKNFGNPQVWTYLFRKEDKKWLVEDVLFAGKSLSEVMRGGCLK